MTTITKAQDAIHATTPVSVPLSVITTCYGRNRHLYNLLSSLSQGSVKPAEIIIVNDDAEHERLAEYDLNIIKIATTTATEDGLASSASFDIGRNRNLGAARATYDAMVFLDVDCIVAPTFIEQLHYKLQAHSKALLMGQPRYLMRPLTDDEGSQLQQGKLAADYLDKLSVFNPYRDNFDLQHQDKSIKQTQDYGAFWSLCFAIMRRQFEKIGGFDTDYVGYGAEDTDFAFMARALNIDFYLTDDVIYHQQHSVYRPPLNHLDSIVINANRFYEKWQHWPMSVWLAEFAQLQLINWQDTQTVPIAINRQPSEVEIRAAHYPDAPYV
ncbi:glycosyltransferase family 2 protein [Psychrobacter sp. P2G3]|uniref:glycosyltransferase family 2 protein n=1 Tax=Psychrobacter sp. P2G3 TaxID=1699622 RepID=UPI00082C6971|nr:glycosyltransferase family 2 protein [Psychrobacter sp. P2G3]